MDVDAEIRSLQHRQDELKANVSRLRSETQAFAIAFSAIMEEARSRDAGFADGIKASLLKHLNRFQGIGDSDLLRALSDLYQQS